MCRTFDEKIDKIKDELEIRSCSLQMEIEKIKNDYLTKLDQQKEKFRKYLKIDCENNYIFQLTLLIHSLVRQDTKIQQQNIPT